MIRHGQTTTFQERLDITERAAAGQSDPEIAAALGCSVWTVRKWRRRSQHQGRIGLSSHMGRPTTGVLSTLPAGMRDIILHLRRTHPGWGPDTLLAELRVVPRRISLDHAMVFYDNTSPSPFPTRLHLWLLALGIDVCFILKRCPTDHAKIERTHQTMTLQALLGQRWSDQTALWAGLDARRAMLNQSIPSWVSQDRVP